MDRQLASKGNTIKEKGIAPISRCVIRRCREHCVQPVDDRRRRRRRKICGKPVGGTGREKEKGGEP